MTKVVVAMSGGVDSSVAAALLKEQGHDVIGLMMRLWSEYEGAHNRCCAPDAMANARYIANQLDIPFYVVDTQDVFKQTIVDFFIDGYSNGVTPNPCMECNRHIRWDFLLNKALSLGATHMATGHYARVHHVGAMHASPLHDNGVYQLLKAVDSHKDQSYVLSVMGQHQLSHAMFPLGEYAKPQVRELAKKFNLPVAEKPDSQDLCFLSDNDYRRFLNDHAQGIATRGNIVDTSGKILGEHDGLPFYTIGQRKGIKIAASEALYVIATNIERNELIVGTVKELGQSKMRVARVNWVSGVVPASPFEAMIKIRYKAKEQRGCITPLGDDRVGVTFDEPLRDITPGQGAVFFDGDVVLGGGIIQRGEGK
ncbi:MAG: tRNA 2-thiouridine(34) synthase MnmA [Chloroflexota bacterium]